MKAQKLIGLVTCLAIIFAGMTTISCGGETVSGEDLSDVAEDEGADDVNTTDQGGQGDTDTAVAETIDDAVSDADLEIDAGFPYPDATFINAVRNSPVSAVDEPFEQKFVQYFRTTDELPVLNITSMATFGNDVIVGTTGGVYSRAADEQVFSAVWPQPAMLNRGPLDLAIVDIADELSSNRLIFITAHSIKLVSLTEDTVLEYQIDEDELTAVAVLPSQDVIYLAGKKGVYLFDESESLDLGTAVLLPVTELVDVEVRDIASSLDNDDVFAATASGLFVFEHEKVGTFRTADNSDLPDNNVTSVKVCGTKVAVGTETGFYVSTDLTTGLEKTAGIGGLPYGHVISIACNENGFLLGHEMGATLLSPDLSQKEYFYGLRWMVDQITYNADTKLNELTGKRLPAVGMDDAGNVWLGGQFGLTRIYRTERTLAEKEVVFDDMVPYFWRMGGFVSSEGITQTPWATLSEMRLPDKDNDGLWTQMMIGGWCFAYATTGDEKYYDYAHKAMQTMYKLVDYPYVTFLAAGKEKGFISRSIISQETDFMTCSGDFTNTAGIGDPNEWDCGPPETPCTVPCVAGKMNQYDYKVCCNEPVVKADGGGYKEGMVRWNPIEVDGKKYVWKADTSSDEIAGHFFGFPIYHDLCAKDDAERALVASYITTVAGYIADNAMNLIDLDGTITTFGQFGPETIGIAVDGIEACVSNGYDIEKCLGEYYGGGWLNSNEGIALLLAAWHVSGDKYFYDVYENLVTEHKYYKLAIPTEDTLTITNPAIANHSDHELAMLAYTTVLRYEPSPERLAHWKEGFQFLYDAEKPERNPWWAAIAALSGLPAPDAENARRTLREIPDDVREWLMDNCHRADYKLQAKDRGGDPQFTEAPPFDEIRTFWWNGNPYNCNDGGYGNAWRAPTLYLLPYYMAKYTGLITDEQ
jgi:hypothetical protein